MRIGRANKNYARSLPRERPTVSRPYCPDPKYCHEDQDAEEVARNMDELLGRRLPVVNRDKRLVGIVSIEDTRPRRAGLIFSAFGLMHLIEMAQAPAARRQVLMYRRRSAHHHAKSTNYRARPARPQARQDCLDPGG
jgi:hypothetical protein